MPKITDKNKILKKLTDALPVLRREFNVSKIGVFGSVARGEETDESDVDVLVEFYEPIGIFRFIELENFLSSFLGKKIDLVTKNALKPVIKDAILRESVYA